MKAIFPILLTFSLILISCNSSTSRNQGRAQHRGERFAKNDINSDGKLDYNEFLNSPIAQRSSNTQATFNQIDQNGDQYLDKSELKTGHKPKRSQRGY